MVWILKFFCRFLMRREIIRNDGDKYLTRFKVFGFMPNKPGWFPWSLYIHQFHRPDADDAPHNHPWKWSCSFILSGGYWELRVDKDGEHRKYWKGPFSINWIPHSAYHMVSKMRFNESWTLFLAGPRVSSWGFLVPGRGHVEWREYLKERGIEIPY